MPQHTKPNPHNQRLHLGYIFVLSMQPSVQLVYANIYMPSRIMVGKFLSLSSSLQVIGVGYIPTIFLAIRTIKFT